MPYTLNGIGTHYYGSKNRSARVGTCQQCGRSATLSAYDTREWFCFIFIPVIPLTKYRILDDCSSCRRHQRIKADEFAAQVAQTIDPLREAARRNPRDPQAHMALVQTLIGWEMRPDAARELADARALHPQNVDLMLLEAQLAIDAGDLDRALPLYERAAALDAQNAAVSYGYGWLLHQKERHQEAVPFLQKAASQEGNKVGATYLLAMSLMKLSRWSEALYAFQQLTSLEPSYANDKSLLRLTRECKQHLGYYPSEAEKRAGRRWWPFGAKRGRAKLQAQPALVRPGLRIAGLVVLVFMLGSLGYYAWDRKTNIEIYLDNGLDRAVQVDLDGRRVDLARHAMTKETLRKGPHQVVVRDESGKEIERHSFDVKEMGFFDAVTTNRFFVYNVAGKRVYRRARHGYAPRAEDSSYSESFIAMKRLIEQRNVDYVFQSAPESISVDSRASNVVKISFNAADDVDLPTYALIRLNEQKPKEAKAAIELAAAGAPCSAPVRRTQMYVAAMVAESSQAAMPVAQQWIADCGKDDLEAHRAYQDVMEEAGRNAELAAEYGRALAESPRSASAHYLYGRVLEDPEQAAAAYRQAIALDPNLAWAHIALAHASRELDRHDEALFELTTALDIKGRDPSVVVLYAVEAIALQRAEDATPKVEKLRKGNPNDFTTLHARWLLAAASGDWTTATTIQKKLEGLEPPETAWWRATHLLRMKGDEQVESRIANAEKKENLRPYAEHALVERLVEKGEFAQAVEAIEARSERMIDPSAALLEAYAGAGLLLEGRVEEGERALALAEQRMAATEDSNEKRAIAAVVSGLRGAAPVESVMAEARRAEMIEHAWFVAAVRAAIAGDAAGAAVNFEKCVRASADLDFPFLEAKAMAARFPGATAAGGGGGQP